MGRVEGKDSHAISDHQTPYPLRPIRAGVAPTLDRAVKREAARAHELIEQAAVKGKIVLMVNESGGYNMTEGSSSRGFIKALPGMARKV